MNLEKLRKERNLTQEEASRMLQMQKQTYQNYELRKRQPDIDTLCKLADFYNTSIDYIVGRETKLINLNAIKPTKAKLIEKILSMNELQELRTTAYVSGLLGE